MTNLPAIRDDESPFALGKVFAESGMFPNVRKEAEAIVKIVAGREFGLGPLAAMNGIHMVDGKPTLAANLIAGQIKRHPLYNYKVVRREDDGCTLEFYERLSTSQPYESVGTLSWNKKDAQAAGLIGKMNWKKYPRDMYFARCLTAGARTFCPDVLGGVAIYTAEELGADEIGPPDPVVAAEVEVIDAQPVAEQAPTVEDTPQAQRDGTIARIRAASKASGKTADWHALKLVEVTGRDADPKNLGAAIAGLSLDEAIKFYAELTGGADLLAVDDGIPGSGS